MPLGIFPKRSCNAYTSPNDPMGHALGMVGLEKQLGGYCKWSYRTPNQAFQPSRKPIKDCVAISECQLVDILKQHNIVVLQAVAAQNKEDGIQTTQWSLASKDREALAA